MTTQTEHHWQTVGYRVIYRWDAYVINADAHVWSLPRRVRGKNGSTRQNPAKKLKPSSDGRVSLSQDGRTARFHIYRQLLPAVFPELFERPQAMCRHGHPLRTPVNPAAFGSLAEMITPNVAIWGSGNRMCRWCCDLPDVFDTNTFSVQFGVAVPDYTGPGSPKLSEDREWRQLSELAEIEHGFKITNSP
jgi:hypothetical protein